MWRERGRRARIALRGRAQHFGLVAGLLVALGLAGCATDGRPTAEAAAANSATVAFESIDGPPVAVFQSLVDTLNGEATARRLPVVSRLGAAGYRVRAYLAVRTVKGRSSVRWVWDVYDADKRRALRIAGEEPLTPALRDPWAGADGEVLARIARRGFDRLAAYLGPSAPSPGSAPAPGDKESATAVAAARPASAPPAVRVPMPPRRPQRVASSGAIMPGVPAVAVPVR